MRNPFEYGGVVSGEAFCNREQETTDLVRAMESAQKLFVFSERRYGKTSLVRAALGKLPRKGYLCAYVDSWSRTGSSSSDQCGATVLSFHLPSSIFYPSP